MTPKDEMTLLLQRSEKLAALEALLLKITHEINNALSVIRLETEDLSNDILQKKIDHISTLIRSLQKQLRGEMPT